MSAPVQLRTLRRLATRSYRSCLQRPRSLALAALVVGGVCVSWLGARDAARGSARHSRQAFSLAAGQVDGAMDLKVQRETDLLRAAGAFMQVNPNAPSSLFERWTADVGVLKRYPELVTLSAIHPVAGSGGGCPQVAMVGPRLTTAERSASSRDICQRMRSLEVSATSGGLSDFGYSLSPGVGFYGESVPVYRTATLPPTAADRRRELLGWVAITLYPQALLHSTLSRFPHLRLELRTTSVDRVAFGNAPGPSDDSLRASLGNGTVEVISGAVQGGSILDDDTAMLILSCGSCLSLLLALVLALLGTSRERAILLAAQKTSEVAHLGLHDGLTDLPNRTLVMDRITHALARATRSSLSVAVLFIDVDEFKTINDTFGHGPGDEILRTIGSRLHSVLRDSDTVGRLGGDEFIVLLEPEDAQPSPEFVAERILDVLRQPIEMDSGQVVRLSASIGVAVAQRVNADQLLRDADLAMYAAKEAGKNRYVVFADEMKSTLADRRALELDLRGAIANDELFLLYQPTFYLADRRLRGVEALLRWNHPERGIVPPDVFIPIAEESGLIVEIGRWVANEACTQATAWRDRGVDIVMAVNVSGRQLDEASFADDIRQILTETRMDARALVLEITETSLMREPETAHALLQGLKTLGVRIAIDDFGTGYSSLAYLRELPVDIIKIDRSFIATLGASHDATALVNTLVQLGRSLRITTLGEGIEDEGQLELLQRANCELGQGFLFARPLPVEEIDELLDNGTLVPAPRSFVVASSQHGAVAHVAPVS
jgi:diguanylate cyclase (GGDEF)-like protein